MVWVWQARTIFHLARPRATVHQQFVDQIVFVVRFLKTFLAFLELLRGLDLLDGLLLFQLAFAARALRALSLLIVLDTIGYIRSRRTSRGIIITLLVLGTSLLSAAFVIKPDLMGADVVTGQEIRQRRLGTSNRPTSGCSVLGCLDILSSGGLVGGRGSGCGDSGALRSSLVSLLSGLLLTLTRPPWTSHFEGQVRREWSMRVVVAEELMMAGPLRS